MALRCSSLNAQEVFVLDGQNEVFQFNGSASSALQRGRAMEVCGILYCVRCVQVATKIVDAEHCGRVRVHVIDQATQSEVRP